MTIAPEVRERLAMLATYLESLPARYSHFNMSFYMQGAENKAEANYALNNGGVSTCGAVACAVGHGPAAGVLFPGDMVEEYERDGGTWFGINWNSYSDLFTGGDNVLYDWMFSGVWSEVDNGHRGAAARIRYLLANGTPPNSFDGPRPKYRKVYRAYRAAGKAETPNLSTPGA